MARQHQKTILEIIIVVLRCFEWKTSWPMCIGAFMQLLMWIRSVPVSNAHVTRAFVHHIVRPHVIAWPRNVTSLLSYLFPFRNTRMSNCPCIGAADVNGASRQPTNLHNRCSEVADDAGIARKRWATALMTARCVGIVWVLSTWRVINAITGHTFWKPVTGRVGTGKLAYQLTRLRRTPLGEWSARAIHRSPQIEKTVYSQLLKISGQFPPWI